MRFGLGFGMSCRRSLGLQAWYFGAQFKQTYANLAVGDVGRERAWCRLRTLGSRGRG